VDHRNLVRRRLITVPAAAVGRREIDDDAAGIDVTTNPRLGGSAAG